MPTLKFDKFGSGLKNKLLEEKKEMDEKLKREQEVTKEKELVEFKKSSDNPF